MDRSKPPHRVCFSDVDGTIMFLVDSVDQVPGNERLLAPASVSGRTGVISTETLRKVAHLRSKGILFAIITGARLSTLLMRLPFLPQADAYVCENGGRIYYPGSQHSTACPLTEDTAWRAIQAATVGGVDQDLMPADLRQGVLWDFYRSLKGKGWAMDANGYTTNFRCRPAAGTDTSLEQLNLLTASPLAGLSGTFNLGAADFYPSTSGKVKAAQHLLQRFGAAAADAVLVCDDDNDLALAAVVGKTFLPSISSESVSAAMAARPDHFVAAQQLGTCEGAEEMLDAVAQHFGLDTLPSRVMMQHEGGEQAVDRSEQPPAKRSRAAQDETDGELL